MEHELSYLNDQERLDAYSTITSGCMHLWSKNKLQEEKFLQVAETFAKLAKEDPVFLAHFTSYAVSKLDSKDLKVVSTFFNSLSDADGTPFLVKEKDGKVYNSDYKKPNLRMISQAALLALEPKLALRVLKLARKKESYGGIFSSGSHYSKSLKTAAKKYLKYRENNLRMIEGIKKSGLSNIYKNIYRMARMAPSTEVAEILRWEQKDGRKIEKREALSFEGLEDLEIAKKIREEKLSPHVALGMLPEKISPVIAVAVLEQATGNQAIILQSLWEGQGLLQDKEIQELFESKISTAKDAIDRVERINSNVSAGTKKIMDTKKSEIRKEQTGDIGRVFVHIDISTSMTEAIQLAKERGSIIAECVQNPEENFFWGAFNDRGFIIERPEEFTQGAFMSKLYGLRPGGMTDCFACYGEARNNNCDVDIYITDQGHNVGSLKPKVAKFGKPQASVIVDIDNLGNDGQLAKQLIQNDIPVSFIKPDALVESALVSQAVRTAMLGAIAVIDNIMDYPLLKLPKYWEAI